MGQHGGAIVSGALLASDGLSVCGTARTFVLGGTLGEMRREAVRHPAANHSSNVDLYLYTLIAVVSLFELGVV